MIHESHTRSDLVNIIHNSNIVIFTPYKYPKYELIFKLEEYFKSCNHNIEFYDETFSFTNQEELESYLLLPKERLSVKERSQIHNVAKKVIAFCRSGYDYKKTPYKTYNDVEDDCLKIREYGDITAVRTAIKLFNITRDIHNQLECNVSNVKMTELELIKLFKEKSYPTLQVKHGKFTVDLS